MTDNQRYTRETKNIWFPDQKEPVYDPKDPVAMEKFKAYWAEEKRKMREGFYLADGQVYISGWLYWHTVYWNIAMYIENEKLNKKTRTIKTPYLRDIEWLIADDFTRCERDGKFYALVGSRDFGKSIIAGSRVGYNYTLFDKSESIVSAGNGTYIKLATDKVEDGLINLHPVFQKQRVINDWKREVKAGWKDKKTGITSAQSSQSSIQIRNFEEGSKTDAAVGARPGFQLIDEIGTIKNFIACLKDSEGAWWSGGGEGEIADKPSCLAMITGTGGDMEKGKEAAEVFLHPEAYNLLSFDNPEIPGTRMGRFISALEAKLKYKEPQKLSDYLGIQHPDLERITILVTNYEKAKEWWDKEYQRALKSGNQKTVLKFKAFWPLVPSDSFLVLTKNDFNIEAAKAQKNKLTAIGKTGTPIELYHDGEKICHRFTDKIPITKFPASSTDSLDAPVVIWEFPIEDPPFGLYVAGVDPYRQARAEYSDSLGAVYIFKRIHDIASDKYQNLFVASYVARPDNKDNWNETARLLIKYYNAYTLCENDEMSFIEYMKRKNDAARYMAPQPSWLKEIVPNTSANREYGIHRSSDRIRNHLDGLFKSYLDEVVYKDENTEILGVTRVFDPMLLEEVINFNSEEGNYDRIVAAELAIALADHLNPQFVVATEKKDPRYEAYFGKRKGSNSVLDFSQPKTITYSSGRRRSKLFI